MTTAFDYGQILLTSPGDEPGEGFATAMDQQSAILIVDDDAGLRSVIADYFAGYGFAVDSADSAAAMRQCLAEKPIDVIILDVMMPGEDGLSALASLPIDSRPPVILLSVLGAEVDRIVGLEMGADDYVAKPCNPRELMARVRSVIRRSKLAGSKSIASAGDEESWRFDGWVLERSAWTLCAPDGAKIDLSPHEFRLVLALVTRARRLVSRDYLVEATSGEDADIFDRSIDVAISRLRRKLVQHGGDHLIKTVRGEGYMLSVAADRIR